MIELRGLKDVERDPIKVPKFMGGVTGGIKLLREYGGATGASDLGAINIWKDNAGNYRGEHLKYMMVMDSTIVKTQRELKDWLREALKAIGK